MQRQLTRTEFTAIERNDPTVPPGHWLDGYYAVDLTRDASNPTLQLQQVLHVSSLDENGFYQIYSQLENQALSASAGTTNYEDYICGIQYNVADFGTVTPQETWRYAYCGDVVFGEISEGPFTMLSDNERNSCNSWSIDWTETRFDMADQKDKQVICHITRPFVTPFSEIELAMGTQVPLILGYNVWSSRESTQREAGKAGDQVMLVLGDAASRLAAGVIGASLVTLTLLN